MNIVSMFAKSPFKALMDHMDKVVESVNPLKDFFYALQQEDFSRLDKIYKQVITAESAADLIKNEVRNHLPLNIFMPINRRDLLEMLDMQDNIADVSQDIVSLLNKRRMKLPEELQENLIQFIDKAQSICQMAHQVSKEFSDVLETSFGRRETKKLLNMIDEVSKAETEADNLEDMLVKKMFEVEDQMKPVDVVFWYQIFEWIGDLADYSKKTGSRLRLMIAQN